ncbi:DUF423-domain-containing protein [Hypomontagnella monticulosa]|nr:DUF423-domain-containing protein [Hypomontagnella monticulosa]
MPRNETTPLLLQYSSTSANNGRIRNNFFWLLACALGASAVGLGAFGAHGLKDIVKDPAKIANWDTAVLYHLVHSLALLLAAQNRNPISGVLFTAGILLFSGSIYVLVLDPEHFRWMGPVTPIGGVCLILGWIMLALQQ